MCHQQRWGGWPVLMRSLECEWDCLSAERLWKERQVRLLASTLRCLVHFSWSQCIYSVLEVLCLTVNRGIVFGCGVEGLRLERPQGEAEGPEGKNYNNNNSWSDFVHRLRTASFARGATRLWGRSTRTLTWFTWWTAWTPREAPSCREAADTSSRSGTSLFAFWPDANSISAAQKGKTVESGVSRPFLQCAFSRPHWKFRPGPHWMRARKCVWTVLVYRENCFFFCDGLDGIFLQH